MVVTMIVPGLLALIVLFSMSFSSLPYYKEVNLLLRIDTQRVKIMLLSQVKSFHLFKARNTFPVWPYITSLSKKP